ncbi:MAG: hypothetical protein QM736_18105 [Vicinamibacterales bacterium]
MSGSFQSNQSPSGTFGYTTANIATTQYMSITRGTTRYPANCPGACAAVAGQVILPSTFVGSPLTPTSLVVPLTPANRYFLDRINQLDFKVQKSFKVNRFTVLPQVDLQREQLGGDDQHDHQQRVEHVVPLRQLDHAAAHARCRRAGEVVGV